MLSSIAGGLSGGGYNATGSLGLGYYTATTLLTSLCAAYKWDKVSNNNHTVALSGTTAFVTGDNYFSQLAISNNSNNINVFKPLTGRWSDVIAAESNSYLLSAGTYTWFAVGDNQFVQLGQGPWSGTITKTSVLTAISGNWERLVVTNPSNQGGSVFALSAGTVTKWSSLGNNSTGQLAQGLSPSEITSPLSRLSRFWPLTGRWTNVVQGGDHVFALSADPDSKGIYRWHTCGSDFFGQQGRSDNWNNAETFSRFNVSFTPLTGNWSKIVAGQSRSFALSAGTNKWFAAGYNLRGTLGTGTSMISSSTFIPLTGTFTDMICNGWTTYALSSYINT